MLTAAAAAPSDSPRRASAIDAAYRSGPPLGSSLPDRSLPLFPVSRPSSITMASSSEPTTTRLPGSSPSSRRNPLLGPAEPSRASAASAPPGPSASSSSSGPVAATGDVRDRLEGATDTVMHSDFANRHKRVVKGNVGSLLAKKFGNMIEQRPAATASAPPRITDAATGRPEPLTASPQAEGSSEGARRLEDAEALLNFAQSPERGAPKALHAATTPPKGASSHLVAEQSPRRPQPRTAAVEQEVLGGQGREPWGTAHQVSSRRSAGSIAAILDDPSGACAAPERAAAIISGKSGSDNAGSRPRHLPAPLQLSPASSRPPPAGSSVIVAAPPSPVSSGHSRRTSSSVTAHFGGGLQPMSASACRSAEDATPRILDAHRHSLPALMHDHPRIVDSPVPYREEQTRVARPTTNYEPRPAAPQRMPTFERPGTAASHHSSGHLSMHPPLPRAASSGSSAASPQLSGTTAHRTTPPLSASAGKRPRQPSGALGPPWDYEPRRRESTPVRLPSVREMLATASDARMPLTHGSERTLTRPATAAGDHLRRLSGYRTFEDDHRGMVDGRADRVSRSAGGDMVGRPAKMARTEIGLGLETHPEPNVVERRASTYPAPPQRRGFATDRIDALSSPPTRGEPPYSQPVPPPPPAQSGYPFPIHHQPPPPPHPGAVPPPPHHQPGYAYPIAYHNGLPYQVVMPGPHGAMPVPIAGPGAPMGMMPMGMPATAAVRSLQQIPAPLLQPPRPRVSLACKFCRLRKLRCTQAPGPCDHCVRRGKECIFESTRTSKSGGGSKAVEAASTESAHAGGSTSHTVSPDERAEQSDRSSEPHDGPSTSHRDGSQRYHHYPADR